MSVEQQGSAYPAETRPYWEAASQGRLLIKHCRNCDRAHHYPRTLCPHCFSENTEWRAAAGRGTVYSFTPLPGNETTRILAFVTLEEGVTMLTNLVECASDEVTIGMKVEVAFKELEGAAVPVFRPCCGEPASAG